LVAESTWSSPLVQSPYSSLLFEKPWFYLLSLTVSYVLGYVLRSLRSRATHSKFFSRNAFRSYSSMVLSNDSPVNGRRNSTSSLNRSGASVRSGYMLAQGRSPTESWFSRFITEFILCGCICDPKGAKGPPLTNDEEEFLEALRGFMERPFDSSNADHMNIIFSIWRNLSPESELPPPVDPRWKKLGFQSANPVTDIRTGLHSVESLEYLSKQYPLEFRRMVSEASNPQSEYPFAASALSIAFLLIMFFRLNKRTGVNPVGSPSGSRAALKQFIRLSLVNRNFFDEVFCVVVRRVHNEWMGQPGGHFDIHYFATALGIGMNAVAEFFNEKRIRELSDLELILKI
jgi:hypothetical protein